VNAESVPRDPRAVQRRKYLPTESAWTCADASSGCAGDTAWAQMHFAVTQPMRYVYCYQAQGSGEGQTFTVFASGDLDGDDVWSQYSRAGIIAAGRPIIGPLIVDNEGE
jgi:hypothetical protein